MAPGLGSRRITKTRTYITELAIAQAANGRMEGMVIRTKLSDCQ